jgi:hypothetical protein
MTYETLLMNSLSFCSSSISLLRNNPDVLGKCTLWHTPDLLVRSFSWIGGAVVNGDNRDLDILRLIL